MLKSLVIIPDIHIPYHHKRAVSAVLDFCDDVRPSRVVQLGDAYDFYSISSFPKKAHMHGPEKSVYKEVKAGKFFWERLCNASEKVDLLPGNHEERFEKQIIDENPGLVGHPAFSIKNLLMLPEKVKVHEYGARLNVEGIVVTHGNRLAGTKAKHVAANVLSKYPNQNTVFGHLHRIDSADRVVYNYDRPRVYMANCIGWLGDYTQEPFKYAVDPNWELGFMYVEFWQDKEKGKTRFTPYQIRMIDGRFAWQGKVYGK